MLPEVVRLSKLDYTLAGNAYFIFPYIISLVVLFIDRGPESFCGNFETLGQKLPSVRNRLVLKVIPERKVAEHFKIRAVTRRVPYSVKVGCTDTLLTGRNTASRRLFLSREKLFKGRHTRIYQKQGLVVIWNKRKALHSQMSLAFKKRKIFFSQIIKRCPFHFIFLRLPLSVSK